MSLIVDTSKLHHMLVIGLQALQITATEIQQKKLIDFVCLLSKWNQAYNLTAVRKPEAMMTKHILDSLSVLPILVQTPISTLVDIGSGAGLPGIPLAIMIPAWQVILIDSNSKKTGFLNQVKLALALENVTVKNQRAEDANIQAEAVICRAVASLSELTTTTGHLLAPRGALWCMKGKFPENELSALPKPYKVSASYKLAVPGDESERHLLKIVKC